MVKFRSKISLLALASALSVGGSGAALAQTITSDAAANAEAVEPAEQETLGIEDIVVTAQRREQNLQNVGAAITALAGEDLANRGVNSVLELSALAPNVTIGTNFGMAYIYVRGIGFDNIFNGAEASVAMHVDGAYIGKGEGQIGEFFDIERVEILRGPQGTLYGRNATGGSVNVITRKPTNDLSGYAKLTYGNYDNRVAEGAISGPIIGDTVMARVAAKVVRRDGFGTNTVTGIDIDDAHSESVRGQLLFDADTGFDMLLSGSYYRAKDNAFTPHYVGPAYPGAVGTFAAIGRATANPRDLASGINPVNDRKVWALTGILNWQVGDNLKLTSLTNYREIVNRPIVDIGVGALIGLAQFLDYHSISQEFQATLGGDGPLTGVAGLYYFRQKEFGHLRVCDARTLACADPYSFPPNPALRLFEQRGTSATNVYAAYVNANFAVSDRLTLIAGARISRETRDGNTDRYTFPPGPPRTFADKESFDNFSPRVSVEFKPTEETMLYASYSRGFKSGIFQTGAVTPILEPETVDAYELGFKSRFFDNTFQLNGSAFYYDLANLQVSRVIPGGAASITIFENAASARNMGIELEAEWRPTPAFRLSASGGYLSAKYRNYLTIDVLKSNIGNVIENAGGNTLPLSPKWNGTLRANYTIDAAPNLTVELSGEARYRSRVFFTTFNSLLLTQPDVTTFQANALFRLDDRWTLNIYGKNLTNKLIKASAQVLGQARSIGAQYEEPRTYGLTLGYEF